MKSTYNKRFTGIRPTSIAMVQGTFAAILGLGAAILWSLNTTIDIAASTNSVLAGLTLGLTAGALSILVVPIIYFGVGWVVGLVQGWVLNYLIQTSGGVEVIFEDNKSTR